jgi:hypothetical protein
MKTNLTIFCFTFVWLVSADLSGRHLSSDIDVVGKAGQQQLFKDSGTN